MRIKKLKLIRICESKDLQVMTITETVVWFRGKIVAIISD